MRLSLLASLLLAGCLHRGLSTTTLTLAGHRLDVEIADTPETRATGLMYRDSLGGDDGMLFVYPDEQPRSFWMENTEIPLSIAFVAASGAIVSVLDMKPLDRHHTHSGAPARYAIEVNQGWFAAHHVAVGCHVEGLPGPSER
ncbi:MAG: DUF192 domain-containing protein [Pseudomonadota bacterium]